MMTIEDRLTADTHLVTVDSDWSDVVDRADHRAARSQTAARVAMIGFALFLAAAVLLRDRYGVETVATPPLTEPDPTVNSAPWSEPSPLTIVLRALIPWGGSVIVGAVAFYASPRDFRAPFVIPRISRMTAVGVWVALWNAALLAITGALLLTTTSSFLAAVHGHAAFIEIGAVAAIALLLSVNITGTMSSVWYFLAIVIATSVAWPVMMTSGTSNAAWLERLATLALHVLVGGLIAWIPWCVRRYLGWRPQAERFSAESVSRLTRRQMVAAALMVGGLILTVVAIGPALILRSQLGEVIPEAPGLTHEIRDTQHPLFATDAPEAWIERDVEMGRPIDDVFDTARTVDVEAERDETTQLLESVGFEPDGRDTLRLRRPRGDSYAAIVADISWSRDVRLTTENPDAFTSSRSLRNLGIALALTGLVLLWSESAVSRYQHGPRPWVRRPRWMEVLGWVLVWAGVTALLVAGAGRLFTPELDKVGRDFWGLVMPIGFVIWLGQWLLVPKPPVTEDDHLG